MDTTMPGPGLECDIVMKGGITSGLVYPLAVVELSKTYRFRNVGGTSAGAIAAAATAAAELGRGQPGAGFELLADLPNWLQAPASSGHGSRLLALFQPQPHTRALFEVLVAALEPGPKWLHLARAALSKLWTYVLLGAVPAMLAFALFKPSTDLEWALSILVALVVLGLGILVSLGVGLLRTIAHAVPDNHFGLCNGYHTDPNSPTNDPPLTEWLHSYLNRLAGRAANDPPLCFGDLERGKVSLMMMTTNLTHGLPYVLPFETREFFFNLEEFRSLFPPAVVDHMKDHSQELETPLEDGRKVRKLPETKDFPLVVAVRLSLSFPGLISAVPLYAVDYAKTMADKNKVEETPDKAKQTKTKIPPERCWFSDGGITSNFPVHFFDAPLPRRPTFAINLSPFPAGKKVSPDQAENVWMADSNNQGLKVVWSRFDPPGKPAKESEDKSVRPANGFGAWLGMTGLASLFRFGGRVFSTAQNWVDNRQLPMPGYRDRIAHVYLESEEGGLNLTMPKPVIERLTQRGKIAGEKLVAQFTVAPDRAELSWLNHRWVRYRATMASLEGYLDTLYQGYVRREPGEPSYEELIRREREVAPSSYRLDVYAPHGIDQRGFALETTQELMVLIEHWQRRKADKKSSFAAGAPNPRADLRAQPGSRVREVGQPEEES